MRKRSSYPTRPLTPGHITTLSDQFICHPASRSIDEIEMAGEIMRDLLKQRDELLAAIKRAKYWMAGSEAKRILEEAIASVKGGAA